MCLNRVVWHMRVTLTINEIITHYQWNYIFNINLTFFAWFSRTALSSLTLSAKPRWALTPPKHQLPETLALLTLLANMWSEVMSAIVYLWQLPYTKYESNPAASKANVDPPNEVRDRWFFSLESSVPYIPPSYPIRYVILFFLCPDEIWN